MSEKAIPMSDVARDQLTVIGTEVFDLRRFVDKHPGGAFLKPLLGIDATDVVLNAHGKNGPMRKVLARFRVGRVDETTLDPLARDVQRLRADLEAEGFFRYERAWFFHDAAFAGGLLALGVALAWTTHLFLSFALLSAASIHVVWWIHDAGHDAVFATEARARAVIETLGILVLGMPQVGYHYGTHRRHHGFTNVIGVDEALETGPVVWHAEGVERSRAGAGEWVVALQPLTWFAVVVPLAFAALQASGLGICWKRRQFVRLALIAVRWLVVGQLVLGGHWALAIGPVFVAGAVLAFAAGLNHFHMPMSATPPRSLLRALFERTQNIDAGRFWTWLTGALNFHVEHHLFSTMPSRNYPRVAARVRALCAAHGVPYHRTSVLGAIGKLTQKLRDPLGTRVRARGAQMTQVLP
jgi:fatty acid desaturase